MQAITPAAPIAMQEAQPQVNPILSVSQPVEEAPEMAQQLGQVEPMQPAILSNIPSSTGPLDDVVVEAPLQEVMPTTESQPQQEEAAASVELEAQAPVSSERKISALSLSSIRARKEMESTLEKKVVNPDDLPKEPFTYEQLMGEWTKYAEKLARSGFMLMSSLMGMVVPVLQGTSVSLEMPNEGSKLSFDENKFDLVNYLRKKLSNYDLEIEIIVNEEVKIQKRVLDKEDKLVRFVELNPAMQYMKEIFDLEFKY